MNLLGNNDNNVVLSVVADNDTDDDAIGVARVKSEAEERLFGSESGNNLSWEHVISNNNTSNCGKSTRASNSALKGSSYLFDDFNSDLERKMDFASNEDMNANLVHHQQQQQQHHHHLHNLHLQSGIDDISDLRPNSLNNILKNNIISSGSHSPGLLMPDINNNSSNDLNLNDDGLSSQSNSLTHGNVSVNFGGGYTSCVPLPTYLYPELKTLSPPPFLTQKGGERKGGILLD